MGPPSAVKIGQEAAPVPARIIKGQQGAHFFLSFL